MIKLEDIRWSLEKFGKKGYGDGNQMDDNASDISSLENILWDLLSYLEEKEENE